MRPWLGVAAVFLMVGLATCKKPPVCFDHGDCLDDDACIEGQCVDVECLSNTMCPIKSRCNRVDFVCEPGCDTSEDCYAYEWCSATEGQCLPLGCRDTHLDCDVLEYCDDTTHECYRDPRPHCAQCYNSNACGAEGACFTFEGDTSGQGYCLVECNPEDPDACPQGFGCSDVWGIYRCVAWCPYLDYWGYL